jgi:hypothetical protein
VSDIGVGKEALDKWKTDRAAIDKAWYAAYNIRQAEYRAKAIKMVEEQLSTLTFTSEEKEEAAVLAKKAEYSKSIKSGPLALDAISTKSPTFKEKLEKALSDLWTSAFRNN